MREHDLELCPCKQCTDRLLKLHAEYLAAWIKQQTK